MYELSVQTAFNAAHAIAIGGEREPVHGHTWQVTVTVAGPQLDGDGLLCDFHEIERIVRRAGAMLDNRDLNACPPFDRLNPTAENVAGHIAGAVSVDLPQAVRLVSVSVTEAPGCTATFRPEAPATPRTARRAGAGARQTMRT